MPSAGPEYVVDLTALVYGGEALGRLPDGRAVFVPFALPGERVRVRLLEEKRSHARAELVEVISPSPQRITPRCKHFGLCGGCHYQHLPYEDQLEAKAIILRDQLERIGKLVDPLVLPTVPSPLAYYYRNTVQFHLNPEGKLGYMEAQRNRPFAIEECHLPEGSLNTIWPQLDFEALPEIERVGLRMGAGEDIQLILESHDLQPPEFSVEEMAISAVHLSEAGALVLAGSEAVVMEVLERPFRVSAGSFFQVNTAMAEQMVDYLLENLERFGVLNETATAIDAYCGVGLFSAFLAPHVGRLIGIEANPAAVEDFAVNLDEFEIVEIYEAPAGEALPQIDAQPKVIVVDPPRSGLERPALDAILALRPDVLAYISCDPATLSRDIRRLSAGGYRLELATPFDLFPQTYHIECMAFMTRDS